VQLAPGVKDVGNDPHPAALNAEVTEIAVTARAVSPSFERVKLAGINLVVFSAFNAKNRPRGVRWSDGSPAGSGLVGAAAVEMMPAPTALMATTVHE